MPTKPSKSSKMLSYDDFKGHGLFLFLTVLLSIFFLATLMVVPEYFAGYAEAVPASIVGHLIGMPLFAWWLMHAWNSFFTKVFNLKPISFGVSIILSLIITVLFS